MIFVETHDHEYGRFYESHIEEWFKPLAHAYILLQRLGYPCIFVPNYYGSGNWYEADLCAIVDLATDIRVFFLA